MWYRFFVLLVLTLFSFCKRATPPEPEVPIPVVQLPIRVPERLTKDLDTTRLYIQGSWQWQQEERRNRGQPGPIFLAPHTEGYTRRIEIDNTHIRYFKNNQPDGIYTYKVLLLKELTGTDYPEDEDPVLVRYRLSDGLRDSYVPLKISKNYLVLQHQYVNSILGEFIWKKQ